jgi:hypothetical protein
VIRVFPRKTKWTPDDELAFVGDPPLFRPPDQSVKISIAFKWDLPEAERLYRSWRTYYEDVDIGGPAIGEKEGDFVPGLFLKKGAVITSRGCRNQCWFCEVWKRNGDLRELPIMEGYSVMDDNILQTSDKHFDAVCEMLKWQKKKPIFSGGLEAKILTKERAEKLISLKPYLYFAYDTEDDYEPLVEAIKLLRSLNSSTGHWISSYCLIGYEGDTQSKAEKRLINIKNLGVVPMALLYRDEHGKHLDKSWLGFQKRWARPALIYKTQPDRKFKSDRIQKWPNESNDGLD